jgi:hypothetical protein
MGETVQFLETDAVAKFFTRRWCPSLWSPRRLLLLVFLRCGLP